MLAQGHARNNKMEETLEITYINLPSQIQKLYISNVIVLRGLDERSAETRRSAKTLGSAVVRTPIAMRQRLDRRWKLKGFPIVPIRRLSNQEKEKKGGSFKN